MDSNVYITAATKFVFDYISSFKYPNLTGFYSAHLSVFNVLFLTLLSSSTWIHSSFPFSKY